MADIDRREFMKKGARAGVSALVGGVLSGQDVGAFSYVWEGDLVDISVVQGPDTYQITKTAVAQLGGMEKFVPKGARVALLPNVQRWHPGTFTKPEIVRAVVQMCRQAGAREVSCLSWLEMKNWEATGLSRVLKQEGADLKLITGEEANFKPVTVPGGRSLDEAMIMREFFNHDVFINMPVTKDHAGNRFTGTMKNLMGLNFPLNNRGKFHLENWTTDADAIRHLEQCIVDLNTLIKPTLCVVDATEFIVTNGPMGPGDIIRPRKVVAGVDRVALDAYCTTLWDIEAEDIIAITHAHERGIGNMKLEELSIKETRL